MWICKYVMMDDMLYIDFGNPYEKLPVKRDDKVAMELAKELIDLADRSGILKLKAFEVTREILEFNKRVDNKYSITEPTFEEQTEIADEFYRLMGKLRDGVRKMKALGDEYENIRQRVNVHYGREIIKKYERPPEIEEMYKDLLGGNEWQGE